MVVIILKRQGVDEAEPVALWEDGEGIEGDQRFTEDPAYEHYTPEMLISEFNGPDLFAIRKEDYTGDL